MQIDVLMTILQINCVQCFATICGFESYDCFLDLKNSILVTNFNFKT